MSFFRIILLLVLFGLTNLMIVPEARAATPSKEELYKNYYKIGWHGTFALRDFDKIAPVPGVNWFVEDVKDWLSKAKQAGWVVKQQPEEAVSGSIVIGYDYDNNLCWVGIAREVTEKDIIFETYNSSGKMEKYRLNIVDLRKKIHFIGYILPQRIAVASNNPVYDDKRTNSGKTTLSAKRAPIPSGEYSPYIGGSGWRFTEKGYMVFDEMIAADQSVTWTGGVDSQGYASGEGILCWYLREGKFFKKYEGTLLKGKRNGKGIETAPSDDGKYESRFEGTFVNDQIEGKGVSVWYEYGQRHSYEGDFVNNRWHGKGIRIWGNGDRYEGDFVKGNRTGYGVLTLANGTVYEGSFVDGKRLLSNEEETAQYANKYPVGTRVKVVRWGRPFGGDYGYAGIVREIDGQDVTLEVIAFINVNNDVEAAPASGGKRLVKGQDIGTLVTTGMRFITGYYEGETQANNANPSNLAGSYRITGDLVNSDGKSRTYNLSCTETGGYATVTKYFNSNQYFWTTFNGNSHAIPAWVDSFEEAAVKACKGLAD